MEIHFHCHQCLQCPRINWRAALIWSAIGKPRQAINSLTLAADLPKTINRAIWIADRNIIGCFQSMRNCAAVLAILEPILEVAFLAPADNLPQRNNVRITKLVEHIG